MRRLLDALYGSAAALAAFFMVALLFMVLLSILSRQFNFHVPGVDAYAGYMMAACGFLSLAHTLKKGEHIRVTLALNALRGAPRKGLEVWALSAATLLAGLFAWYSCKLTWDSWEFNDVSTSSDGTPLWIPQLSMAIGAVIFAIAFLDELVLELKGQRKAPAEGEILRNE